MFVTIGTRPRPEGLVGLFVECHQRIRSFITLAETIGRRRDASYEERREACARCRRYFVEAFPLHLLDEEESLLPRLSGKDAELDAALEAMHLEHGEHAPLVARLLAELDKASQPDWGEQASANLIEVATRLTADFSSHLRDEEQRIFPRIASLLTEEEQKIILAELRARRQPLG